jgi:hypothetical protein
LAEKGRRVYTIYFVKKINKKIQISVTDPHSFSAEPDLTPT